MTSRGSGYVCGHSLTSSSPPAATTPLTYSIRPTLRSPSHAAGNRIGAGRAESAVRINVSTLVVKRNLVAEEVGPGDAVVRPGNGVAPDHVAIRAVAPDHVTVADLAPDHAAVRQGLHQAVAPHDVGI